MRAEHLSNVSWLRPWLAPEVILENMVSLRSEIYSVVAIIWEIWAGKNLIIKTRCICRIY